MIPTAHLRYVMRSAGDERPTIEQLWIPLLHSEAWALPLEFLVANGGQWRPLPFVADFLPTGSAPPASSADTPT